jgi:hypothetical protein
VLDRTTRRALPVGHEAPRARRDVRSSTCTTRAMPLSFRAIKDLPISHCTVGRKRLWSDIMPAGTPKRRLSESILDNSPFGGCQILNRSKR